MYKALGLSDGQTLLVQGIYGAVGPITNFLCVLLSAFCALRCLWHKGGLVCRERD